MFIVIWLFDRSLEPNVVNPNFNNSRTSRTINNVNLDLMCSIARKFRNKKSSRAPINSQNTILLRILMSREIYFTFKGVPDSKSLRTPALKCNEMP